MTQGRLPVSGLSGLRDPGACAHARASERHLPLPSALRVWSPPGRDSAGGRGAGLHPRPCAAVSQGTGTHGPLTCGAGSHLGKRRPGPYSTRVLGGLSPPWPGVVSLIFLVLRMSFENKVIRSWPRLGARHFPAGVREAVRRTPVPAALPPVLAHMRTWGPGVQPPAAAQSASSARGHPHGSPGTRPLARKGQIQIRGSENSASGPMSLSC